MVETFHKGRIRKILNAIYCSTVENKLSEIANSSKNLLLRLIFDP